MQNENNINHLYEKFVYAVTNSLPKEEVKNLVVNMVSASETWTSRYRRLNVKKIVQDNSDGNEVSFLEMVGALEVLEKYGKNLLKEPRPAQWKTIRLSNSVFRRKVDPMMGSRQILQQLGYTKPIVDGYSFPPDVLSPNVSEVISVTADIVQLKFELLMMHKGIHPKSQIFKTLLNLEASSQSTNLTAPNSPQSETQNIDTSNEVQYGIDDMCVVCGLKVAEFQCNTCNKVQCAECDKIWHQSPARVNHKRIKYKPAGSAEEAPSSSSEIADVTPVTDANPATDWEKRILQMADTLLELNDAEEKKEHLVRFTSLIDEQISKYKDGSSRFTSLQLSNHLLERAKSLETAKEDLIKLAFGDQESSSQAEDHGFSIDINISDVRGPPSSHYIPSVVSLQSYQEEVLFQGGQSGVIIAQMQQSVFEHTVTETVQQPSTSIFLANAMTIQDIHMKTKQEDKRRQCIEMIDILREAEGKGYSPANVQSVLNNYNAETHGSLQRFLSKELYGKKFPPAQEETGTNGRFTEAAKRLEKKGAFALDSDCVSKLQGFYSRLNKKTTLRLSDFLKMDTMWAHRALITMFSVKSEPVSNIMLLLLTHSCESEPFLATTICDFTDIFEAAQAFPENLDGAVKYLKKQCMVCFEMFAQSKVECMTTCSDNECKYCYKCLESYLRHQIKEGNIRDIVCPVCKMPDIDEDEETTTNYFNYLDVVVRTRLESEVHTLFQQKLRDQTLMKMPNFRWCSHCTNGFLFELEETTLKMVCTSCQKATCYSCKKRWEAQHEGLSCEKFLQWKQLNDPDFQAAGLAAHLKENGIDCPTCKFKYDLAKGGCMHFKCLMCSFQFCSGCKNPFKQGKVCNLLPSCHKKGLHAHHPRDCLFYLRDMDADQLKEILNESEIEFETESVASDLPCQVREQKETSTGLIDDVCGRDVHNSNTGLCSLHYKEYLVNLINNNKLDPACVFSKDELITCLNRVEGTVPQQLTTQSDEEYVKCLLDEVRRLPLTHQLAGKS